MSTPFEKYEKKLKDEWAKLSLIQETCEHPKEFVESKNEGCSAGLMWYAWEKFLPEQCRLKKKGKR